MRTSDFEYDLPEELIAQEPHIPRDKCRMLVLDKNSGAIKDAIFSDVIEYLKPGDLLVANETRVLPARLLGHKRDTRGAAEVFLLREVGGDEPRTNRVAFWEVLVKPGKRLKPKTGAIVDFCAEDGSVVMSAEVVDWARDGQRGERVARISTELDSLDEALHAVGKTPLPPYIKDYAGDDELYQTVYSRNESSAAAPTAGLHFTEELIQMCRAKGIDWATVELEVGLDTFRVVDEEDPLAHKMHTEFYSVGKDTALAIERCKANGGRVIAVGTTSVRSLESAAASARESGCGDLLAPCKRAATSLFIYPGYEFQVVDALITNFHVPRSTLMMLVSAFAGYDNIMSAYKHAVDERYRLLSFGDAMLIH